MTPTIRTGIAALLSFALGTGMMAPAPARANEDVAKILAGIVALYITSEALKDRNKAHATPVPPRKKYVDPRRPTHREPHPHGHRHAKPKIAPEQCLRNQWTHRGHRQVYGARCMARRANAEPPRSCMRHAHTNDGPRRFYTKRCLRRNGWQL